jgi:drug/metabolite transporter (DMT)-like permease
MGQILLLDRGEFRANRPGRVTGVMFGAQALVLSALALVAAPGAGALLVPWASPAWVGLTLVLAVVCTVGAFSIMNAWQPRVTATEAGLIYCMEPVSASVLALFLPAVLSAVAGIRYPNESLSWALVAGGALITLANVLVQTGPAPP